MALWKRGRRWWTQTMINGVRIRQPLCPPGSTRATTKWQDAVQLEKDLIKAALAGKLNAQTAPKTLFEACDKYLQAKEATANTTRAVEFDRERLEVVKRYLGDIRLSSITRETIEGFQAKRRVDGASNRTVNMDVGALRRVLKRFKYWHRLEDDVKMLTESGGAPIGRALTTEEQERLFEVAQSNPEWAHVYCAAVLAANTSMRGVEIKHLRRKDIDLQAKALHIRKSKNEGSKRILPLNEDALAAVKRMIERADELGHGKPEHYLWCGTQHHKIDPTKPAAKWDTAWRALRDAAGLRGLRFHDLRHTVVTRLLEAGEPDHVVESITGHLSRRMLEHYSHIRLTAKKAALDRLNQPRTAQK
jgi:integrase